MTSSINNKMAARCRKLKSAGKNSAEDDCQSISFWGLLSTGTKTVSSWGLLDVSMVSYQNESNSGEGRQQRQAPLRQPMVKPNIVLEDLSHHSRLSASHHSSMSSTSQGGRGDSTSDLSAELDECLSQLYDDYTPKTES